MRGFLERVHLESLEPWIALLLAVIISLTLMATSGSRGTEIARSRTGDLLELLARPFTIIPQMLNLKSENSRLRAENVQLKTRLSLTSEAARENERLRSLLNLKENSQLGLIPAEVTAKNPLPGVNSLLIDRGASAGLKKHMAVINDRGLVGKVIRVNRHSSVVQLLADRNLGAAVRLSFSRTDGITSWVGEERMLVEGIAGSSPVRLGEEVITSGLDGVFPPGIRAGQVIRTERSIENLFLQIEMAPAVDFSAVEEVFVVQDLGKQTGP